MSGLDPLYYNDNFRLFFQHKLWWWFIFLRSLTFGYCGAAAPLLFRQRKSGPDSAHLKVLDRWLALLAVASFVIWWLVFRDIHKFLGFHRPSKRYCCAIYITSAATIIPSFFLHIQIAFLTSKTTSPFDSGLTRRGILLFPFLAASGLYLWMVHRFLLNDNEEHYEPIIYLLGNCTASTSSSEGQSVSAVAALEPYSDSPPSSDESRLSSEGHLFKAYTTQRISDPLPTCELDEHLHAQGSGVTETELTPEPRDSSAPNPSESTTLGSTDNQPTSPLRCRTVARFDYMCQSRIGPHSWLSYPLTLVILGIYSTILFGLVANLIYKNRFLIFSSPNAKCGLRVPLGGYLLCGYAMKRGLRQSLFSRSRTPLPEPWIEIKSLVGKPMFINSDTGASTNVDPRLRAFPVHRQDRRAGIRSTEYMEAYNNTGLSTCKEYWGHLGRVRTTRPRMIPTVFCLLFVGFASFQVIKGFLCIYNTPAYQLVTIMTLWGVVLKSSGYFAFFTAIYALWSIFSVLALRGASARAIKGTGSPNVI